MKKTTKKQLTAAILAGLTLAVATPAMAAANPFADVPAKHWAYDSVSQLAAAGIVDGYGDGTFRGDRTMTRYEMAQIVAKAMAHEDKANAEQKAMIEKLAKEFQDELDNLGVRVGNLEKKIGNITWSGQVREWYQWRDNNPYLDYFGASKSDLNTRLLLFLQAPLTDNLSFHGRIWAESGWGETSNAGLDSGTGAHACMDQAYLEGHNGNVTWTLGRQGIQLGQGLIYAWFANNDGATLTFGGDKTKLTLAAFKHDTSVQIPTFYPTLAKAKLNIIAANISHKASDDLDLSLAYAKNRKHDLSIPGLGDLDADAVDSWALGAVYKGINNVTLTAEYGQNKSDAAKALHNFWGEGNDSAKAWVAQAKYKGAQWEKPHSYGFWVGYRKAEPGFIGVNGDYVWETPTNINAGPYSLGYFMDNVKGFDYGFDYTVFKNGILTLQYFDLEDEAIGFIDKKGLTAQLRYQF